MSKYWYPVINYKKCDACGACIEKCNFGVYNKREDRKSEVVYQEGCM